MVHISIPVQKHEPPFFSGASVRPLIGALLVGVLVGIAVTGNFSLPKPSDIGSQLGAVGNTVQNFNTETNDLSIPPLLDGTSNTSIDVPSLGEVSVIETTQPTPSLAQIQTALTITIDEHVTAIDRVNQEMLRIKNESVALVMGFNQNCGNWSDVCALPYKDALDANNANYDRLVNILQSLTQELNTTRTTLLEMAQ